ncbi:galactose oxidase [Gigaspora margarita]|uniref:Galactose oxidase n=1 Tax=Gigaspora margarita TaxID=4874 RepID=A0A8H4EVH3_GIGMA|nr:galactose oxidase [Gigaspora margarita]
MAGKTNILILSFIPNGRWAHSSVLIDNKLYFKGGNKLSDNSNEGLTNELFYLDVSKPFTTTDNVSITWINLTYTDGPLKGEATSCIGGKNNDIIFEFGGYSPPNQTNQTFVNQFDTSKQQWSYIESVGPGYRQDISCAKFSSGLIAIFSGLSDPYTINDLWIFNTLTLSWNLSNAVNSPPQRFGYCAITLPNENILYIGGRKFTDFYDNSSYMPMNILPLYNTKSHMWTNMNISGPIPPIRTLFSAILTPDRRVIIFGGCAKGVPLGDLWILDTVVFQWSIGRILNSIEGLVLCGHTATLVEIYMIVAFGSFVNGSLSSKLFMLDVSQKDSYRWVNEFTTNVTFPNNTIISDFKISNLSIGAITGCVIFLAILIIAVFCYRTYKNLRHKQLQEAIKNMSI